ncbi:hypothetical protein [Nodularia sphaerocarpa]|uniref:hypothetical protein n=1 Tax=Nodularia sphaerocarpa TaxID=137816 RepID=UPI001EFA2B2E|nr:hypothetical protein [Nodularia sphaerocarpa]MDB9375395.1 hypothetical protein [Nodularia sphaerocarpa CS-585]MDB9376636.1 hypothetical protein [Nodularia sphaerocarpa CS-585A2]
MNESHLEPSDPHRCLVLSNVGNVVQLEFVSGIELLEPGESFILPAALGEVRFVPDDQTHLIVCYVPDLSRNVMEPLQAAGYDLQQIQRLGELW